MRCEQARKQLSLAMDGALDAGSGVTLDAHLAVCGACREHLQQLERLRRALRYEPVGDVPDVAGTVVARAAVAQRRARWRGRVAVAAAFVAAAVAGGTFVGFDFRAPAGVHAAVPERVLEAQSGVATLEARVVISERGWHPAVPERRYTGFLAYRAPEALALSLTDETTYPDDRWVANDVVVVSDGDTWWARGPVPCPQEALPACAAPAPRPQAITGREPFRAATPTPLDLVVPVGTFATAAEPEELGERTVDGRRAFGLATSAAQVAPILDGLRQAGTLREVHPADEAELWLDADTLVPLALTVRADVGSERALWAVRHGYADEPGEPVLVLTLHAVTVNGDVGDARFPPPPADAVVRDAGFTDLPPEQIDVPEPGWLPEGMRPHRSGVLAGGGAAPPVAVATWSDGRAWVRVRATTAWDGRRLFGALGAGVRRVDLGAGVAYVGEGGSAVAVHAANVDAVVAGSLPEADLRRIAGSLGLRGRPVPPSWAEDGTVPVEQLPVALEGALVPPDLDGFAPAAARLIDGGAVVTVTGPGARGFVLTQAPGAALAPPLEPDVRGVEVRGTVGRYTPRTGELEWVEGDRTVSLRSATLALEELVAIAERLERRP